MDIHFAPVVRVYTAAAACQQTAFDSLDRAVADRAVAEWAVAEWAKGSERRQGDGTGMKGRVFTTSGFGLDDAALWL